MFCSLWLFHLQAMELSANRRYQRATLTITVLPTNRFPPVIKSSTGQFVGYVKENSHRNSFIMDTKGERALRLIVTDPDMVGWFLYINIWIC